MHCNKLQFSECVNMSLSVRGLIKQRKTLQPSPPPILPLSFSLSFTVSLSIFSSFSFSFSFLLSIFFRALSLFLFLSLLSSPLSPCSTTGIFSHLTNSFSFLYTWNNQILYFKLKPLCFLFYLFSNKVEALFITVRCNMGANTTR